MMSRTKDIVFEVTVRFWRRDEPDIAFSGFQERVKANFEKAKLISQGMSQAKIVSVKVKEKIGD